MATTAAASTPFLLLRFAVFEIGVAFSAMPLQFLAVHTERELVPSLASEHQTAAQVASTAARFQFLRFDADFQASASMQFWVDRCNCTRVKPVSCRQSKEPKPSWNTSPFPCPQVSGQSLKR